MKFRIRELQSWESLEIIQVLVSTLVGIRTCVGDLGFLNRWDPCIQTP